MGMWQTRLQSGIYGLHHALPMQAHCVPTGATGNEGKGRGTVPIRGRQSAQWKRLPGSRRSPGQSPMVAQREVRSPSSRHDPARSPGALCQETLQSLPLHPYDSSEVALAHLWTRRFIEFETNHYSRPFRAYRRHSEPQGHGARDLDLTVPRWISSPGIRDILPGWVKKVENPDHFKTKKIRYGLEPVREAFLELGERAEVFLKGLTEKHPRNCGFQARYILRMKEHYQSEDIHRAIEHAIRYQAFEARSIERILRAKATPRHSGVHTERTSTAGASTGST